jgi:acetolactate synthase regulatory subunit
MSARLHIRADADPQALPRVLGLFSQRWLVPAEVVARLEGDMLHIECHVPALTGAAVAIVAAKLQEMVLVHEVAILAAA